MTEILNLPETTLLGVSPTPPSTMPATDARFWARVYATLIDSIILFFVASIINYLTGGIFILFSGKIFSLIFGFILQLIYYSYYLTSADQATPGMKFHNLKLVDGHGDRVTLGRVIVRELLSIISFWVLFMGYLMILMTKYRQTFHDLVTCTYVQDTSKALNIDAILSQATGSQAVRLKHDQKPFYSGFWRRFGALIVDNIITLGFAFLVVAVATARFITNQDETTPSTFELIMSYEEYLMFFIFPALYWIYFTSSKHQATPGKMLFALKVMDRDGHQLSAFNSFIYYFSYYYSAFIFGIGFIMAAFTQRKQGFHNKISRTYVVCVPRKVKARDI